MPRAAAFASGGLMAHGWELGFLRGLEPEPYAAVCGYSMGALVAAMVAGSGGQSKEALRDSVINAWTRFNTFIQAERLNLLEWSTTARNLSILFGATAFSS